MFKDEGNTWLYLIGILIMFAIYVYLGREFFVPFMQGERDLDDIPLIDKRDPPPVVIDVEQDYIAKFETNYGIFTVDLFEKSAPNNVNNFVYLATTNYYNGTYFHRLVPKLLIQGGDRNTLNDEFNDDGEGGPGYIIPDEINWESLNLTEEKINELRELGYSTKEGISTPKLEPLIVAMASAGPDTNGSQFFILFESDAEELREMLNGKFTPIGKIIGGENIIKTMSLVPIYKDDEDEVFKEMDYRPKDTITIFSVEVFNQ